jgi:hypothetical protein
MRKVTTINLHQTIQVDDDFEIKAYYAGHVLGAAMFYVRVGTQSVVYTVRMCLEADVFVIDAGRLQHELRPASWRSVDRSMPSRCAYYRVDLCDHDSRLKNVWYLGAC